MSIKKSAFRLSTTDCGCTDSWIAMPRDGAPCPRYGHAAIWTGSEMIIWGGWASEWPETCSNDTGDEGARYTPPGW